MSDTDRPTVHCFSHPDVVAAALCTYCNRPLCRTCLFRVSSSPGVSVVACPDCAGRLTSTLTAPVDAMCARHPEVKAITTCTGCQAWICTTCDFSFPGGVHLCPTCAAPPSGRLSRKRKIMVGWALGLAAWGTLGLVVCFSGILNREFESKAANEAFNTLIGTLLLLPTIAGAGLGIGCMDRRLGNPGIVWAASIWNGVLLLVWVLLSIVGVMA